MNEMTKDLEFRIRENKVLTGEEKDYVIKALWENEKLKSKKLEIDNVIERSKINEIIEKIKDESYLSYDDNPRIILDEDCVLEIIKEVLSEKVIESEDNNEG
jgi:hypothetical protein